MSDKDFSRFLSAADAAHKTPDYLGRFASGHLGFVPVPSGDKEYLFVPMATMDLNRRAIVATPDAKEALGLVEVSLGEAMEGDVNSFFHERVAALVVAYEGGAPSFPSEVLGMAERLVFPLLTEIAASVQAVTRDLAEDQSDVNSRDLVEGLVRVVLEHAPLLKQEMVGAKLAGLREAAKWLGTPFENYEPCSEFLPSLLPTP